MLENDEILKDAIKSWNITSLSDTTLDLKVIFNKPKNISINPEVRIICVNRF